MTDKRTPRSIELSEPEITWINSAADKRPDTYFRTFEMNEKQSAHRRYARLIGSGNNLPESERKRLMDYFEMWKTNSGLQFWCDRRTHLSAMRTASSLVEASEPYANQSLSRNVSWITTSQQQDYVDPIADLEHYKVLNQEHLHDFSLARDGIADMRHSSKFRKSLAPHIGAAAGKVEPITTTIYEEWPTLEGILGRVFAESHYKDVSKAGSYDISED
ncbi:hypothetical protein BGZ90_001865 [Linnemannia elongata]|nr:hypothetical protein BGZ90_001865 [Linnemannia elongata]